MPLLLEEDARRQLPTMYRVRQNFQKDCLADVERTVRAEFSKEEIRSRVKPGMKVALGVGSRGIRNLSLIVRCVVEELKIGICKEVTPRTLASESGSFGGIPFCPASLSSVLSAGGLMNSAPLSRILVYFNTIN